MKVSYCVTCMGRLHHLRATLPHNLHVTRHDDCEFVLLDYNSVDGCWDWVRSALAEHLESGRVRYYRTETPRTFHMSKAKNLAHRLAAGDVLCNLDADNLLVEGFAAFLQNHVSEDTVAAADYQRKRPGTTGRIAVLRRHFVRAGGYDERIPYCWEDYDLRDRLVGSGLQVAWIPDALLACIEHDDSERMANLAQTDLKDVRARSRALSEDSVAARRFVANQGAPWGRIADLQRLGVDHARLWTFCVQAYHDAPLLARCLTELRRHYATARVVLRSDGDRDPHYRALAHRFEAEYEEGKDRLYGVEHGGAVVHRLLELYAQQPTEFVAKIDTDTLFLRRFRALPFHMDAFGALQTAQFHPTEANTYSIQGGFFGFARDVALSLLDARILLCDALKDHRTWARSEASVQRATVRKLTSFDWTAGWALRQLGFRMTAHPEVHSTWEFSAANFEGDPAIVHPVKDVEWTTGSRS